MKAPGIQQLLNALGAVGHHSGSEWIRGPCPLARWTHAGGHDINPSFGVRISTSESIAKCYSCEFLGNLEDLVIEVAQYNRRHKYIEGTQIKLAREIAESDGGLFDFVGIDYDVQIAKTVKLLEPIPMDWFESFPRVHLFPLAVKYLKGRGVMKSQMIDFNIRWDPNKERVCFPVFNAKGELKALQGRTIYPDVEPRFYMYPHKNRDTDVWFNENEMDLDRSLVVTEGAFDALSIARCYSNVVAGLMASVSHVKMRKLWDATHIVTWYDSGKGGNEAREKMTNMGVYKGIPVTHIVPDTDAGDQSEDEVQSALDKTILL